MIFSKETDQERVIQTFSSDIYVNAFLKELEENNIRYELKEVSRLEIPDFTQP